MDTLRRFNFFRFGRIRMNVRMIDSAIKLDEGRSKTQFHAIFRML